MVIKYETLQDTKMLVRIIAKHPDWPIIIEVGEDTNIGDYAYTFCSRFSAREGEILDTEAICDDEIIYSDRDEFEQDMIDWLYDSWEDIEEYKNLDKYNDEIFEEALKAEITKYDRYWKDCIILTVD